ncbi:MULTISPECIES: oligosaccharide flippase family protein [unclassified Vibrio]|uniref:oligosaccharide flippase family protein n=1 Tax=unclassified Vibrio TaxID=2614977 RepID=UPI001F0FD16D|nr:MULTISPECIES: oligosaccharide flippase family protein [unclassified Vibrio]
MIFSWGVQFINYLSPLLVLPYLSRVLSIEDFGQLTIVWSICLAALVLTEFGFNLSGPYFISKRSSNKEKVSRYISSSIIIKLICYIILFLLASFVSFYYYKFDPILFLLVSLNVFFLSFQLLWFFQGIERMKSITLITFSSRFFYILATFIFVNSESTIYPPIFILTISNLIGMVFSLYLIFIKYNYKMLRVNKRYVTKVCRSAKYFYISRASVLSYSYLNNLVVGIVLGPTSAALYTSCEKLYSAGQSITSPIAIVLYPYLSRTRDKFLFYKIISIFSVVVILGVSFFFYYSEEVLKIVFGDGYIDGSDILRVFLIISVVNFLSVNFGYPAFSIKNRIDIANKSVIIGAFIQMLILPILYYYGYFSEINLVLSVLAVESVVLSYRLIYYFKV